MRTSNGGRNSNLSERLAEAEALVEALLAGQVDAVVDSRSSTPLLVAREQEALRLSQRHLRDIIDGLGPGIFVALLTPDGILVEVNKSPLEAAGLKPADVLGRPFDETPWWAGSAEARQQLREAIARAAGGVPSRYDVRTHALNGDVIDIDFSIQPMRDENGTVIFLIPSASVITERKQMEVALRRSDADQRQISAQLQAERERLVEAQAVAKVGSWETHIPSGMVSWSRETHRIFETDSETFRPTHQGFLAMVHPDDRRTVDEVFTRSTPGVGLQSLKHRLLMSDGRIKFVEERWNTHSDGAGLPLRAVGTCQDITEHHRTATALENSMGEFRALTEAMPQLVWIAGPEGGNIYVNQQWTDYTGFTLSESSGDGWARLFHPDDAQRAWDAWQKARDTGGIHSMECRLRRVDGAYRWWLVRGVPVKDGEGRVSKWFGTCTDIHDLQLARLEVTRTNRALKMLGECSEAVVRAENESQLLREICRIAVDSGGYRMAWVGFARNDEAKSITPMAHAGWEDGYLTETACTWDENDDLGKGPTGEVIRTGQAIVSDDFGSDPSLGAWFGPALQRGYRGVIRLPLRDGSHTFGLLGFYSAEPNQAGADEVKLLQELADNAAFGIASLRADAERRRMQAAVEEQATLLDIASEAIQVTNLDGRIIYWNKGAERIYGWTAAEVAGGIPLHARFKEESTFWSAREVLLTRREWEGEIIKRTRDGRDITVEERWTLIPDELGQPKSIFSISSDVTEKKKLESQLIVSDRMASVGTLAAGIAHEINNPLAAVIANMDYMAEFLETGAGPDLGAAKPGPRRIAAGALREIEGPLQEAREAAQRVRSIVRDLKIFSRTPGEDGIGPVDARAVMESSVGMAWNEIRHRARLEKDFGDVPAVEANEGRLGQVFLNLLVNAAQAVPEGRAEHNVIQVRTRLVGDRVITSVCDTGPGIPPEIIGRIFDAFFTTKPVGFGTGLGLAICQRIITDMGGDLTVTSVMGKGATFSVSLPASRALERPAAPPVTTEALPGRRGRILVVDDEKMLISIITRILAREHDVVGEIAAKDALARCAAGEQFDLILCDLMMPDMTGMDLHRELTSAAPEQANRMIFMTGGAFTVKARQFLTDPPREHIEKPFDAANLRAIARRYLR